MASHFETTPPEVVECIAQHLQLRDLISLRLACKILAEKTLHYFGRTYYSRITTNMSFASIERLENLSKSMSAVSHVRTFGLIWDEKAGDGLFWDREAAGAVLTNLPVVKRMIEVLVRLSNVRAIEVENPDKEENTDKPPTHHLLGASDMLGLGFILIAELGTPIESLRIQFNLVVVEQVHLEQISKAKFKAAVSTLKELWMRVASSYQDCDWAWSLAKEACQVQKLYWCVRSLQVFHPGLIGSSHIQDLGFRSETFAAPALTEVLLRSRHCLRVLSLVHIRLQGHWRDMFRCLGSFDKLESVSFHFLRTHDRIPIYPLFRSDAVVNKLGLQEDLLHLRKKMIGPRPRSVKIIGVDYRSPDTNILLGLLSE